MLKGYIFAILAAAFYGTNPIFAVPLYRMGMEAGAVLLLRYFLGLPVLAAIIIARSEALLPRPSQVPPVAVLGIIMAISSLALYESYNFMNPGLASTLLFMYPLLTAILMSLFFHEKFRLKTAVCLAIMFCGLYLLMRPGEGLEANWTGFIIIFISALSYAVYLVLFRASRILRALPPYQSLMWQLAFGSLVFLPSICLGNGKLLPDGFFGWLCVAGMVAFPTILSLLLTIRAIPVIGPTPVALFGALEPVTAVILSWLLLGEAITMREIAGGALIVFATTLVMTGARGDDTRG